MIGSREWSWRPAVAWTVANEGCLESIYITVKILDYPVIARAELNILCTISSHLPLRKVENPTDMIWINRDNSCKWAFVVSFALKIPFTLSIHVLQSESAERRVHFALTNQSFRWLCCFLRVSGVETDYRK
jgi:hypothetical protein